MIWVLIANAGVVALAVVWSYRRQGGRGWQPGHGLSLIQSFGVGVTCLTYPVHAYLLTDGQSYFASNVFRFFFGLTVLVLGVRQARLMQGMSAWRWMFYAIALQPLARPLLAWATRVFLFPDYYSNYYTQIVVYCSSHLVIDVLVAAFAAFGIAGDRRRNAFRHWAHWAGLAPVFIGVVLTVLLMVLSLLGPEPEWS